MAICKSLVFCLALYSMATVRTQPVMEEQENKNHVIIVGGGLAGLTAVIEAASHGAKVTLFEMEKDAGGNSAKASSGINGCGTAAQTRLGITDSVESFYADTIKAGHSKNRPELVEALVHQSAEAIDFLIAFGVDLSEINLLGGHAVPRTHWLPSPKDGKAKPVGMAIMGELKSQIAAMITLFGPDHLKIMLDTRVTSLLTNDDGHVIGVSYIDEETKEPAKMEGTSVILTTGGFSNDRSESDSLLREFAPDMMKYPTTNGNFATGDGVKMARAIGARLDDMEYVQLHPTGFVDPKTPTSSTKFLAAEALRGMGGLLLNQDGRRFANELGTRDYLTHEILVGCKFNETAKAHTAYLIMNQAAVEQFGKPAFNFYWKVKGFFQEVKNAEELATVTGMSATNIRKTFEDYTASSKKNPKIDEYHKTVFPVLFDPEEKLYFSTITPSIHYTMGGLTIDEEARVIRKVDSQPIPGLFAAGEVTAGVHGANRLGGNSLLECVVFGRIAAMNAARGVDDTPKSERAKHEEL